MSVVVEMGPRPVKSVGHVEVRGLLKKPVGPEVYVPRAQGGHRRGHDRVGRGCSISDKKCRTRLRDTRGLSGQGI